MHSTRRERLRAIGGYSYIWLMVGFFTGTLLLVGPVRLITSLLQSRGWSDRSENLVMVAVIGLYVLASAGVSWWLFRRAAACRTRRTRLAIPVAVTMAAAVCLWGWMNPALLAGFAGGARGTVRIAGDGPEFVFGPYPERTRLEELKREGFTAVVSLQHPAVLPFEPPGIAQEQRDARDIGLTFIHAPMLPWVSSNDDSLNTIRALAHAGAGRYYVHCGLGRDRVNLVKQMLEREGRQVAEGRGFVAASRTLALRIGEPGGAWFERGDIRQIEQGVWLIPYPNRDEMWEVLSSHMQHVVLLLDPSNSQERVWRDEAVRVFKGLEVPHTAETLTAGDHTTATRLAAQVKRLPRPVVIIVPFLPPHTPNDVAATFVDAYTTNATAGHQ